MQLPEPVLASPWAQRALAALAAVRGAGAALVELRGSIAGREADGGQLKTSTDLAAEGWVMGFLRGGFPDDLMLAEEQYEAAGTTWPGAPTYWTIDALDGTRSYVEGYPGFCVQVAFIEHGEPVLGVIGEPVAGVVYIAARGAGAWRLDATSSTRLVGTRGRALTAGVRIVDSTRPADAVGALYDELQARFVECGSVGLKICRVIEDAADIYAKRFRYKLWDVAPGEVLARETNAVLSSWSGERIDYAAARTHFGSIVVADAAVHAALCARLAPHAG